MLAQFVQYNPTTSRVDIICQHVIISQAGNRVQQHRTVISTQTELEALMPAGQTTWGDDEVITFVEQNTQLPCVFIDPNPSSTQFVA